MESVESSHNRGIKSSQHESTISGRETTRVRVAASEPVNRKDLIQISRMLEVGEVNKVANKLVKGRTHAQLAARVASAELLAGTKTVSEEKKFRRRYRQYNALLSIADIHTQDDTAHEQSEENPLVDILILLARGVNPNIDDNIPDAYQLCVKGKPESQSLFHWDKTKKTSQFSDFSPTSAIRNEYRTISNHKDWEQIAVRAFYLFAQVSAGDKEVIKDTFVQYQELTETESIGKENIAVGLLDMLNNAGLLEDKRFQKFALSLAEIAQDELGGFAQLYNEYYYRVMDNKAFWRQVVKTSPNLLVQRKTADGRRRTDEPGSLETNEQSTVPNLGKAFRLMRTLYQVKTEYAYSSAASAIGRTAGQSRELQTQAVVRTHARKSALKEQKATLEQQIQSSIRASVMPWLNQEFSGYIEYDPEFLESAATIIIDHFNGDRTLNDKITNEGNGYYPISGDSLTKIESLKWLTVFQQDKSFQAKIEHWAEENPKAFELWMKMGVYDIGKKIFATRQSDFLYSTTNKERERVRQTIENLASLCEYRKPDIWVSLQNAQVEMKGEIDDVVEKKKIQHTRRQLNAMQRHEWLPLPRSLRVSSNDIQKFLFTTGLLAGITGVGGAIYEYRREISKQIEQLSNDRGSTDRQYSGNQILENTLNRAELLAQRPLLFARVLHAPTDMTTGEGVNYLYLQTSDRDPSIYEAGKSLDDSRLEYVEDINKVEQAPTEDQIVYRYEHFVKSEKVLPPNGWRFVRIISEKSQRAGFISANGKYALPGNDDPEKVIFVAEPMKKIQINSRILRYQEEIEEEQEPTRINREYALNVNEFAYKANPELKRLADQFVIEIDELNNTDLYNNSKRSEIIMKYIRLYGEYTDTRRYYALSTVDQNIMDPHASALYIANNPERGYYCQVAAHAFEFYLDNAGVRVEQQPGIQLRLYNQNQLWGDIAHVTNIIYLPNGEVIHADMTPNATEKTPQEDTTALKPKNPSTIEITLAEDSPALKIAGISGLTTALLSSAVWATTEKTANRRRRKKIEKYCNISKELSPLEHSLIAACSSRIAFDQFSGDFIESTVHLLQLIHDYNPDENESMLQWLTSTDAGAKTLDLSDAVDAFNYMQQEYYADTDGLRSTTTKSFHNQLLQAHSNDMEEIPYGFRLTYELAQILRSEHQEIAVKVISAQLATQFNSRTESGYEIGYAQRGEKAKVILQVLKDLYAGSNTNRSSIAYLNAIYALIS